MDTGTIVFREGELLSIEQQSTKQSHQSYSIQHLFRNGSIIKTTAVLKLTFNPSLQHSIHIYYAPRPHCDVQNAFVP